MSVALLLLVLLICLNIASAEEIPGITEGEEVYHGNTVDKEMSGDGYLVAEYLLDDPEKIYIYYAEYIDSSVVLYITLRENNVSWVIEDQNGDGLVDFYRLTFEDTWEVRENGRGNGEEYVFSVLDGIMNRIAQKAKTESEFRPEV